MAVNQSSDIECNMLEKDVSLLFYPSDGVKVGDEYEGERSVEAFQKFINEKKSGKVEELPKKEDQVETGKKKMTRKWKSLLRI